MNVAISNGAGLFLVYFLRSKINALTVTGLRTVMSLFRTVLFKEDNNVNVGETHRNLNKYTDTETMQNGLKWRKTAKNITM